MKLYPSLPPYTKINSDYITDPNVRAKSIKHFEENSSNLRSLGLGNDFLDITPKAE